MVVKAITWNDISAWLGLLTLNNDNWSLTGVLLIS